MNMCHNLTQSQKVKIVTFLLNTVKRNPSYRFIDSLHFFKSKDTEAKLSDLINSIVR